MERKRVLFVCVHNSARSQMAEAYLNMLGGEKFFAESAGLEPGVLNPVVVKLMLEDGIDISGNKTKSVFELFRQGKTYDYVITVCDPEAGERCPIFPGKVTRYHWFFDDPSGFKGNSEEVLQKTREVRDKIKEMVKKFILQEG
ncbi:MAG: arsenate reductase ArsC [Brevinematia bacterium]